MTTNSVNKVKLWRAKSELTVGEITKYRIYFDPRQLRNSTAWPPHNLVLKVTNTTPFIYRGAILAGPYNISATCAETSGCFNIPKQPAELIVPQIKAGIKCGETWKISLSIPKEREDWTGDWTIEILSDIVFTCNRVQYEVSLFSVIDDEAFVTDEIKIANIKDTYEDDFTLIEIFSSTITYEYFKPKDIFYLPDLTTINNVNREIGGTQDTKKSVHLVVLTHGIHGSMLDELYLREVIEEKCKHKLEHKVIVYMSDVNHSVTEDGIEKCGKRLAESILEYVGWPWISSNSTSSTSKDVAKGPLISKISFIGHSLGGLINIFLIGYLNSVTNGIFFKDVEPVHYIAIASPLLGSTDLAWIIKIGMEWGVIGQTGKDLTLVPRSKAEQHSASGVLKEHEPSTVDSFNEEPLLLSLSRPNSSSHIALKLFKNRTLYANTSNDATVSLRTSSLFFINHDCEDFIKDHNATIFDHLKHLLTAINPPETTKDYLTRSFSDKSPILHDKLYTPDDIPPITNTIASDENEEDLNNLPIEEQMARLWHKDMTWRKVLVSLEGEAHTHVIVRRKWINAAGWQVIDHLLNNHEF